MPRGDAKFPGPSNWGYRICSGYNYGTGIDSIVKGLETVLINTFPADSPCCAVDNIVDSFHGCF